MALAIVPFTAGHLDRAAALLAARHRADRVREPALPARYEAPAEARSALRDALAEPMASGVVAVRDGRVTGYLIGFVQVPSPETLLGVYSPPRSGRVSYAGHAVDPDGRYDTYRAMYAALAPRWLAAGCFAHVVIVAAGDRVALEAWFSLGFGQDLCWGLRDAGPVTGAPPPDGVLIRRGQTGDLEDVVRLVTANDRYHTGPPIFAPYPPEADAIQRTNQQEYLNNPANAWWLAYRDGRAVGVQTFTPDVGGISAPERSVYLDDGYTDPAVRGAGIGSALLDQAMAWAREQGYGHCTVAWHTSNLLGSRFWLRSGFRPLVYRLARHVDERIAWATGSSDRTANSRGG